MAVLLQGNGINRNEGLACSWEELLTNTFEDDHKRSDRTGTQIDESDSRADLFPSIEGLTMTLGFDLKEFYAIDHAIAVNSTDLKRKIADSIRQQMEKKISEAGFKWEKTVHWDLMNLPIGTYLTTNYDYALETAYNPSFKCCRGSNETIYSRYRRHAVDVGSKSKTVYHIHEELHVPRFICLGFEQYSETLLLTRKINHQKRMIRSWKLLSGSCQMKDKRRCNVGNSFQYTCRQRNTAAVSLEVLYLLFAMKQEMIEP